MDPSNRLARMAQDFCHTVAVVNEWSGRLCAWLVLPLTAIVVMEVVLRYVFNRPTIWAWDVNVQLQAALVVLGGGYALLHKGHVSVDILVTRLSLWRRAMLDAFMGLFLIGGVGLLLWRTAIAVKVSVACMEDFTTAFAPPIYPLKIVIFIGVLLLFLQGIARFIGALTTVLTRSSGVSEG